MGQARNRGTREERVSQALVRVAAERAEQDRKEAEAAAIAAQREAEKKAAMTPAQLDAYKRRKRSQTEMMALAMAFVVGLPCERNNTNSPAAESD